MTDWKPDNRPELVKTFGDYTLTPERNSNGETAHLIDLGDRQIRVLPDGSHSGQKRAQVVRRALETAVALKGDSGGLAEDVIVDLVVGHLARNELMWERIEPEPAPWTGPLVGWLEDWFSEPYMGQDWTPQGLTQQLLSALDDHGFEIVEKA